MIEGPSSTPPTRRATDELLIACLCAQWCQTCDAYHKTFASIQQALAIAYPDQRLRWRWIDVEDEAQLLGDLEIENFPTLLISAGEQVLFLGPLMPHALTLRRLVQSAVEGNLEAPTAGMLPESAALARRLLYATG